LTGRELFLAGLTIDRSGIFTLLGTAIGGHAFCAAHTQSERVDACKPLLEALGHLDDPPNRVVAAAMCQFLQSSVFSQGHDGSRPQPSTQLPCQPLMLPRSPLYRTAPWPGPWAQATLSTSAGDLGLRHASRHASAGF